MGLRLLSRKPFQYWTTYLHTALFRTIWASQSEELVYILVEIVLFVLSP